MAAGDKKYFSPKQIIIAVTLAHTHCSMNGLLYAASNKDFRQTFMTVLRCLCSWCKSSVNSEIIKLELELDNADDGKSVASVSTVSKAAEADSCVSNCLI